MTLERLGAPGLTRWNEAVTLEPCAELPLMIAADVGATEDAAIPFLEAHHAGVHFGFIADRVCDGQADPNVGGLALLETAASVWEEKLGSAIGSLRDAKRRIRAARRYLAAGVHCEQRDWALRSPSVRRYARAALARFWWAGLAADYG